MAIDIGDHVRILEKLETALLPTVMKLKIQRVTAKRDRERQVTRWHSGQQKFVSAWIPLKCLRKVPSPKDSCLISNISGSGPDAWSRQHCLPCQLKNDCIFYQQKINEEKRSA